MQPAPSTPGGPVIERFVRRLVAGPGDPLAELARACSRVTGGAAVVVLDGADGSLRLGPVAAVEADAERHLVEVLEYAELTPALRFALQAARPQLYVADLPPSWQRWANAHAPLRSLVVPIAYGESVQGWLWIGAQVGNDRLDPLRDLAAVAAMRRALDREVAGRDLDALDLEAELSHRGDELERANQTVDALAAVVGHDVREAFRELLGWARVGGDLATDERERIELLRRMRLASERVGGMIGDLLEDVVDAQALRRDLMAVDLNGVVGWVRDVLDERLHNAGAHLVVGTLPTIRSSPTVLRGILLELVRNAIEHGGPTIMIRVTTDGESNTASLSVEDDGPGIPVHDREMMFAAGQGTGTGAGLGLSRVRASLAPLGGTVSIDESRDGGIIVRVDLPALPEPTTLLG